MKKLFVNAEELIKFARNSSKTLTSKCGIYELSSQFPHYFEGRRGAVELIDANAADVKIKVSLVPNSSSHDYYGSISIKQLKELEAIGEYKVCHVKK